MITYMVSSRTSGRYMVSSRTSGRKMNLATLKQIGRACLCMSQPACLLEQNCLAAFRLVGMTGSRL
jgi:hypothetical protein